MPGSDPSLGVGLSSAGGVWRREQLWGLLAASESSLGAAGAKGLVRAMESDRQDELRDFARLQERLVPLVRNIFPDPLEPRSVVVIPSLSMDKRVLEKVRGVQHYEERLLCMLMLLQLKGGYL